MKNTLIITFLLGLTACAGSSGGGSANTQTLCDQAGVVGTWQGTISGNADTMVINSSCLITSTYCGSETSLAFSTINQNCGTGSSSCGQGTITIKSTNGAGGCSPASTAYSCSFGVSSNKSTLTYNCGSGDITYTK